MDAVAFQGLVRELALLCVLSGMVGAVFVISVLSALRTLLDLVARSDWWLDRVDRAYVRSLNASQRGRMTLPALFWLSAVLAAALSACSAPVRYDDDHAVWLERVKAVGW